MINKLMTFINIILVSVAASFDISHIAPLFKDVIFLLILVSGIGMSLTLDNNRPDVDRKITVFYILFSFFASIFFSGFAIAAYVEFDFKKFYFYVLIGTTATLSPQFARKILPQAPEELKNGAFGLLRAFFSSMANKLDDNNNDKKQEDETE